MKITSSEEKQRALGDAFAAEPVPTPPTVAPAFDPPVPDAPSVPPAPAYEPATVAVATAAPGLVLDDETVRELAIDVIKTIFDPEIPVNIWELGLIYDVTVPQPGYVHVLMTLTAPNCPAAQSLPGEVTQKLIQTPGIQDAEVEITFDPAWEMSRMSEAARLQLGLM